MFEHSLTFGFEGVGGSLGPRQCSSPEIALIHRACFFELPAYWQLCVGGHELFT